SVKGADATDGARALVIKGPLVASAFEARYRQERLQDFLHGNRSAARTSTAVRSGKRLVQVEVHDIDAEIARSCNTHQSIHIGAVHVKQRTFLVQDLSRARNLF